MIDSSNCLRHLTQNIHQFDEISFKCVQFTLATRFTALGLRGFNYDFAISIFEIIKISSNYNLKFAFGSLFVLTLKFSNTK